MASRKDLLKAHTFITGRLTSALVDRDPDDPAPPIKRQVTGMWVSVMIGILVLAGFGVVGLIKPGNSKNWQADRTVIVDSGSGGTLAFLNGKLYPTYNITSAKLATGGGEVKSVKPSSLRDFPRERMIGIRSAPAQLPDPKDVTNWPIRTCSVAPPVGSSSDQRFTTLEIGTGQVPGESASFVAKADDDQEYLVASGRAYALPTHAIALHLGFGEQIVRPGSAWLRALPQGPRLDPLEIPGRGSRSKNPVQGLDPTIGTLMHVDGAIRTSYVLLSDGLSEISPLEAAVLEVANGKKSIPVRASDANEARNASIRSVAHPAMPFQLPTRSPIENTERASVCATWVDSDESPRIAFGAPTPPVSQQHPDEAVADTVVMPSLRGALLRPRGSGRETPGTLVVDGKRYAIADTESRAALGYGQLESAEVEPALLKLIPEGMDPGRSLSIRAATEMG
ncbi:type VII secretion system ESX-2 subunit EccB2 [Mariniluteicoccus endophyticus]